MKEKFHILGCQEVISWDANGRKEAADTKKIEDAIWDETDYTYAYAYIDVELGIQIWLLVASVVKYAHSQAQFFWVNHAVKFYIAHYKTSSYATYHTRPS